MKITQDFATTSDCYRAGRTITIKGLMLHSVGCNQPDPKVFARLWKNSKDANDVCCHGVLGADGTVIQTLPWNRRGVASGHADVEHIWNKYGLTMNQFRKDVKAAMNGGTVDTGTTKPSGDTKSLYRVRKLWTDSKSQIGAYSSLENAKKVCKDGYTVYDESGKAVYPKAESSSNNTYKVRVSIDDLNIRTGAGTEYPTTGKYTGKGVFTIVETKNGWGRLKSGGWICLDYAVKI